MKKSKKVCLIVAIFLSLIISFIAGVRLTILTGEIKVIDPQRATFSAWGQTDIYFIK